MFISNDLWKEKSLLFTLKRFRFICYCHKPLGMCSWTTGEALMFCGALSPSRVQVNGVTVSEAAVDASWLEEEAVVWAGRHVAAPRLTLEVLQQVEP